MRYFHKFQTAWYIAQRRLLLYFFWLFPIKKNKIVISSYFGKQYGDNPMYISKELEKIDNLDIVWIVASSVSTPKTVRTVLPDSIKAIYELATARMWIDNCRKPLWLSKRKNQYYVQTWHGGVCLKQVEADTADALPKMYVKAAKRDSHMADLFISECEWRTNNYRKAFWYTGEILKSGIPRSDILFTNSTLIRQKVLGAYNLPSNARLVLYAPTFRNNGDLDCYDVDFDKVLRMLESKFDGEWYCLYRLHPNISDLQKSVVYDNHILNGSKYQDMNELLVASEVLITDYSGCLFDGLRIGKMVFIFAKDYEEYIKHERSLYFDIRKIPAPFAESNDELTNNIKLFDRAKYDSDRLKFVSNMGYYGEGNSTSRITNYLLNVIEGEDGK